MIRITRGFRFITPVKTSSSQLIIKGDDFKICVTNLELIDGNYYLTATAEETANWKTGSYKYQIINNEYIEDEGEFVILQNYALTEEYETVKTRNEILLEAIDAQIAGKATSAQQSMTVGDKSISYCTLDELFKLREYFKRKVAEEQGESVVDGNELKIKFRWSLR